MDVASFGVPSRRTCPPVIELDDINVAFAIGSTENCKIGNSMQPDDISSGSLVRSDIGVNGTKYRPSFHTQDR